MNVSDILNWSIRSIFPWETLEQCSKHYCPTISKYVTCGNFGASDGMDGSCLWCQEMTPLQWWMCQDKGWLDRLTAAGFSDMAAILEIEKLKGKRE